MIRREQNGGKSHNETAMVDTLQNARRSNRRGYVTLCICIACGISKIVAVALRFVARRRMKARLRRNDWFIFASLWPNYAMITTGGFRNISTGLSDVSRRYPTDTASEMGSEKILVERKGNVKLSIR